jgi:hypothetical protein
MIDLAPWYEGLTTISHIAFAGCAGEELLLVDEHRNARIFSLNTRLFRFVFIHTMPNALTNRPTALPLSPFRKLPYPSSPRLMDHAFSQSPIPKVIRSFVLITGPTSVPQMAL